jgi:HD-GYP domain-containing protein (c-di-GMP phosphodiesterase class II)
MKPIVKYPVYDLENNLLVRDGTELSPDFMNDFCAEKGNHHSSARMLAYKDIKNDLLHQFTIPPYNVIFTEEETKASVLGVLEHIVLPLPVFQVMDYFRKNDFHSYRHMLIISALTTLILDHLDPRHYSLAEEFSHFGPLHDLGKYTVPLAILKKTKPLTVKERDLLRHHAVAGYILVSHYLKDHRCLAAMIALDHHERRNGTGYSRGIEQDNLTVEITTVCDIYDALVAQRPYRPVSFDNRTALEELTWMAQRGDIGWKPVQVLVAYNRRKRTDVEKINISMERRGRPPRQNVYGILAPEESRDRM